MKNSGPRNANKKKTRISTKQGAALSSSSPDTQKADAKMELESDGELRRLDPQTQPAQIDTESYYQDQGKQFGGALVQGDTPQVTGGMIKFIDATEFHLNVSHRADPVTHPSNHRNLEPAVGSLEVLWPTLKERVPEALRGRSLEEIKTWLSTAKHLNKVEKRLQASANGVGNQRAVVENLITTALRGIYDLAEPVVQGDTLLQDDAEPLDNLFYGPAAQGVENRRELEKRAQEAVAGAQKAQEPGTGDAPSGTGTGASNGGQGTVGIPVTQPGSGSGSPPPSANPPVVTTGRSSSGRSHKQKA